MCAKAVDFEAIKSDEGVKVNGVIIHTIVEKCEGCNRVREFEGENFCSSYPNPSSKWALGSCNFATHIKAAVRQQAKVNPLKASKRAAKGKGK